MVPGMLRSVDENVTVAGWARRWWRWLLAATIAVLMLGPTIEGDSGSAPGPNPGLFTTPPDVALPATSPSAPRTLTTREIALLGEKAVVEVQRGNSAGTGIYLGADRVLTANHVVTASGATRVRFGTGPFLTAEIVRIDAPNDLALLRAPGLDRSGAVALRWGDSRDLHVGDRIVAIGYPVAGLTVTAGIVSALKQVRGVDVVQTDTTINPGNSGGPLLNEQGALVGVADFTLRGTTGLNFAVAAHVARSFVEGP